MIHILTIHWKNDCWVDIQLKYLADNIKVPYKIYAFLNSLQNDHKDKYFYSSTEDITSHAIKLNLLADMAILHSTNDDDWLMFIDGDAFPIGDIISFSRSKLKDYPLLAIQRKENLGDIQPHPSFCITTVKFWKNIKGDWKSGYEWQNIVGDKVTDVGGNLLSILDKNRINWFPLLRSNETDLHKLWFGIYEDLIYHHGAGFRRPISRFDITQPNRKKELKEILKDNMILSEKVYRFILKGIHFYNYFKQRV